MFMGSFLHTIDSKGRLSIPAKYREILLVEHGGKLILTNHLIKKCIIAYTPKKWKEIEAKIEQASSMDEDVEAFSRLFFSSAEDCSLDNQGRILISPRLREHASLTREVLVAGTGGGKIEIWSPALWEQTVTAVDPVAVARKIAGLGI